MDPEQVLTDCRELARRVIRDEKDAPAHSTLFDAVELAEKFQSLDEWLKDRGFLPADWAHPQPVPHDNTTSEQKITTTRTCPVCGLQIDLENRMAVQCPRCRNATI